MFDQTMGGESTLLFQADNAHGRTVTFTIVIACLAITTSDPWKNQDLLTAIHPCNIPADSFNNPCDFMSESHGQGCTAFGECQAPLLTQIHIALLNMQIGVAKACGCDAHQHFGPRGYRQFIVPPLKRLSPFDEIVTGVLAHFLMILFGQPCTALPQEYPGQPRNLQSTCNHDSDRAPQTPSDKRYRLGRWDATTIIC